TGAALLADGEIVSVFEEERHSREKHTIAFPHRSLAAILGADGAGLAEVDAITVPWDQRRLLRTFAGAIFRGLPASLHLVRDSAHSTQDGAAIFMNQFVRFGLWRHFPRQRIPKIISVAHHDAHAAMFFVSPFDDATIIVMDGYGDDSAT